MKILDEYQRHCNRYRPHQSRGQRPPDVQANPPPIAGLANHPVRRTPILSGLINEYQHAAGTLEIPGHSRILFSSGTGFHRDSFHPLAP